jgi:hypothetical protein
VGVHGIGGSITGKRSYLCQGAGRVIVAVVLKDIILDQWVLKPAIDSKVGITGRAESSRVGDVPVNNFLELYSRGKL